MEDKRRIYRVILQLMTYISVAVLLWVMFSSAFVANEEKQRPINSPINMSLQQLEKGEVTHVLWQGKRIAILYRNDVLENPYFVFYDLGDSGNCPLYFNGKVLKDACTGTQYSQNGIPVNQSRAGDLDSPPHYLLLEQKKVIIGSWK
ncbi:MAG: hypothetical protein KAG20_05705 [Cocleimonas sp.]|nr:hypothetical protein [Cocleimonas sp.]